MERAGKSSHSCGVKVVIVAREPEVCDFDLDEVSVVLDWLIDKEVQRFKVAVQNGRVLCVQIVHAFGDVECHSVLLLDGQMGQALLVQQ